MKLYIKKIPGVRGFIGTTYAVFAENGKLLRLFLTKREAAEFVYKYHE